MSSSESPRLKSITLPRILWSFAFLAAITAFGVSGAIQFGYLPGAPVDLTQSQLDPNAVMGPPPASSFSLPKSLSFNREDILNDYQKRIDEHFAVEPSLHDRVSFWFDVYTKFDENKRILHHSTYPWIVFKVVDVSPIIEAELPNHRWMRNELADKFVKNEAAKVRASLNRIGRARNPEKLSEEDLLLVDALRPLGKNIQKSARLAARSLRMQVGQKNHFENGLAISSRYLKGMEKIFADLKLPTELTRLPFVESSFNDKATSRVGAAGIWQFMGNTGRKFLMVNNQIDERRSPLKASAAAAHLLKENHLILHHSWPLAVTAWNHGPEGVRKAMRAAGTQDLGKIISRYRSSSFSFASMNFYSEFLAALYAEKYSDQIFDITRGNDLDLQVVRLPRSIRIDDLIKVSGLSREAFLALNPEIEATAKTNGTLPAGFKIHVTEEALSGIEGLLVQSSLRANDRNS
jgi:membrane-bound lytic murein transglycosylase D